MKKKIASLTVILALFSSSLFSQFGGSLEERPGTFEILSRTDYAPTECGFTKADMTANLEKIKDVVAVIRQNPVMSDIKGFNGRARIYSMSMTCKGKSWYGVSSRVSFEFCSFFLNKKGEVVFNTIEPPSWSLYINDISSAGVDYFSTRDDFFTVPLRKKVIGPGIDVYDGELWVIYDPSRPPYWIPVTIEEAFASVYQDIKNDNNELGAQMMKEMVDKEYADIPEADRSNRAYFGGNMSRVSPEPGYGGQDSIFPYIMKVNPEYWNKELPKSAVQFIWLNSPQKKLQKEYIKSTLDDCRKQPDRGSGCDLYRFELSFGMTDIRNLSSLIGK